MINYDYIDSDFAFWYDQVALNTKQPDIHLNFWVDYESVSSFIDIGIRFYKGTKVDQYFIYVPFEVENSSVEDLFETFSYEHVLCGIFNKTCKMNEKKSGDFIEVLIEGEKEKILPLYKTGVTYSNCGQGTILRLNISNVESVLNTTNVYFRWRLPYSVLATNMKKTKFEDFSIDSPYLINNFRHFLKINEIRNLPLGVKEKLNSNIKYFDKVIIILVNNNKIEINTEACYKIRALEPNLYDRYKPKAYTDKRSNVYQWHIRNEDSCSVLVETKIKEINWISLLIYFFVIVFISCCTEFFIECLIKYIL